MNLIALLTELPWNMLEADAIIRLVIQLLGRDVIFFKDILEFRTEI